MIPTRSPLSSESVSATMRFAFSIRLGAMSSVSILFETSMANTRSTPSLFTVPNCVPILGFANPMKAK